MKTSPRHLIASVAIFAACTFSSRADSSSYQQVIQKRDAVLSQILAAHESRLHTGVGEDEAVSSAQIALYSFRRDTASSQSEKIKQQGLIVNVLEKQLSVLRAKASAGLGGNIEMLMATDRALQATQLLEELKLTEKKA
jgi:hypothetical protein